MPQQRDEQLISRMCGGDREAFAALYDRHAARTLGYLAGITGTRAEAEDVLQETFWQVWNRAATYDPSRGSPLAWILRIARSRAIDLMRRRTVPSLEASTDIPAAQDVADAAEREELMQSAHRALDGLAAEERDAIRLVFYRGLTHVQVAARTGTPLGTVKTRIRRGMQRLRESLNGHDR